MTDLKTSVSPNGEEFPLPVAEDYQAENDRLEALVKEHKALGHEIVVVMGVGFVGAVMAGVVADSCDKETGEPGKFVIGMQRLDGKCCCAVLVLHIPHIIIG